MGKKDVIEVEGHEKLKNGDKVNNAEIRKCLEPFLGEIDDGKSEEV